MFASWNTYDLSQDDLRLEILPGVGGRLWDVSFRGQSLLFQNPDLIGQEFETTSLAGLPTRSPQFGFPLWGGEKTWIAPDSQWPDGAPYPALDSGSYEVINADSKQVHLRSDVCPDSGLQIERTISLLSGSSWSIQHTLANQGTSDRYAGIWSVLMLDQPARVGLNTGPLGAPIPVFGFDDGLAESHGGLSVFDCNKPQEFKLGANNPTGKVFMRMPGADEPLWLCCMTPRPTQADVYAHGHDFEVFNSGDYAYCEAEWHFPAQDLQSGSSMTFLQEFQLWPEPGLLSEPNNSPDEMELFSCMS